MLQSKEEKSMVSPTSSENESVETNETLKEMKLF